MAGWARDQREAGQAGVRPWLHGMQLGFSVNDVEYRRAAVQYIPCVCRQKSANRPPLKEA